MFLFLILFYCLLKVFTYFYVIQINTYFILKIFNTNCILQARSFVVGYLSANMQKRILLHEKTCFCFNSSTNEDPAFLGFSIHLYLFLDS